MLTLFTLLLITTDSTGFTTKQFPMSSYEQCVDFTQGILASKVRELPLCVGYDKDVIGLTTHRGQPYIYNGIYSATVKYQYWDIHIAKRKLKGE